MRRSWLFVSILLVALAPSAAAQSPGQALGAVDRCTKACDSAALNGPEPKRGNESVHVVLYGHVADILNRAPMNTERPDPVREPDRRRQFPPCAEVRTGTPADVTSMSCRMVFFSSPGHVEVAGTGWRTHQQPGQAYALDLRGPTMNLYLTLSTSAATPNVGMWARLETGRFTMRGDLIAESSADLVPRRTLVSVPGDPYDAYEFEVPLRIHRPQMPGGPNATGFILTVEVHQLRTSEATVMQPWQLRVGHKFPPRLVFETATVLRTASSSMAIFQGSTYIRWSVESALGTYNVRDDQLRLVPTGTTLLPPEALEIVSKRRTVDHDGHFKPMNITWRLNHTQHRLDDGTYELLASIPTLDGAYLLEEGFSFQVRNGKPVLKAIEFQGRESPNVGPLVVVALMIAFTCWHRRQIA